MNLRLIDIKPETDSVKSFFFKSEQPISWLPGQYLHYVLEHEDADDRGTDRWFTISAAPFEKNVRITTRFASENGSSFKKALGNLKIGDTIKGYDVEGDFTWSKKAKKHILVAGGIGATPYRSMLKQLAHDNKPINAVLMYANQDNNLVFIKEFEEIAAIYSSLSIQKFIGEKRILAEDFKIFFDDSTVFYISGPRKMVINYQEILENLGAKKNQIKTDYFPGY
jgi:ferredoxin-NADP reductase